MSAQFHKISERACLCACATALLASSAFAQQSSRFPNGQTIPLAGIGIAIDQDGRKITYDLDTEEIIKIEVPENGMMITNSPAGSAQTITAPQRVERAPLRAPGEPEYTATPGPMPQGDREFQNAYPEQETYPEQNAYPEQNPYPETDDNMQAVVPPLDDNFGEPEYENNRQTGQDIYENPREPYIEDETQTAAIIKPENPAGDESPEFTAKLQVLLDRYGISPGVIDGRTGSNVAKALRSLSIKSGRNLSALSPEELEAELAATGGPAFMTYTIAPEDVNGPFIEVVPADYADKAKLPELSYTSALEALAEQFHMDEDYLRKLNPGVDFARPGSTIQVVNTGPKLKAQVARIEADKSAEQVRAYDMDGNLVAAYPATIGSTDTPSPTGTVTIERIALDPNYTYNPKINFTQGENKGVLTIPPGPNGPVGSVWMALSKPTYGIHGTPDPSRIGKTNSHGCVRLTNWDAQELAGMVTKGVTVEFLE